MRSSSALKRELSGPKLSTVSVSRVARSDAPAFDRQRLVDELLSLGHQKISPELAESIGEEVEVELRRRSVPNISPELISEIVRFKLEELGLIKLRSRHVTTSKSAGTEEATVSLPEEAAPLPPPAAPSTPPPPPKAALKIAAAAKGRLQNLWGSGELAPLENLFEKISAVAAAAEAGNDSAQHPETLAVEFYNSLANQEFYPHLPELLNLFAGDLQALRFPSSVRIAVSQNPDSLNAALQSAATHWRRGHSVVFSLLKRAAAWDDDSLKSFFGKIEEALLHLSEIPFPPSAVGLELGEGFDFSLASFSEALNGKYYPRFEVHFVLPMEWIEGQALPSELEKVLKETWKKSEPRLVLLDQAFGAGVFPSFRSVEPPASEAFPALSLHEVGSLGSLNLSIVASGPDVDWGKLRRMTRTAIHFLDNLETTSPSAESRLGLGMLGFAELLLKLGIPYDSEDAVTLAEKLLRFVKEEACKASQTLAEARGASVPGHKVVTILVPEPALAELAGVSPGLEARESWLEVTEEAGEIQRSVWPLLRQIASHRKVWNEALAAEIIQKDSVREAESAALPLRRLFVTRREADPEWRLKILAAVQKNCEEAITVSLQLSEGADLENLREALAAAATLGLRRFVLEQNPAFEAVPAAAPPLSSSEEEILEEETVIQPIESCSVEHVELEPELIAEIEAPPVHPLHRPRERPEVLQASSRLIATGCGTLQVSFARDGLGPYEVRASLGRSGTCAEAQTVTISKLLTLCLSSGIDPRLVYEQLLGVHCPKHAVDHGDEISSCMDGLARVFERELGFSREEEEITELTPHLD
ncbi:MAG TPA: hypothetical protein DF383_10790 [Deltaproteobacteria bacterium]|nr:hypothetical protein [Deltaproteobacteria bacterium]